MGELLNTLKQTFAKKSGQYYELRSPYKRTMWTDYPRPQLKRASYMNLNGEWQIYKKQEGSKRIMVPFAPQSCLSEYECDDIAKIPEELLYEREFVLPKDFILNPKDRVLLHFGAVDQIAQVFINARPVGRHEGGYLSFTCDITDFVRGDEEVNRISVLAEDRLDHTYPWGKQKKDRGGMWYTPVSGIWQTVWLEAVPETYIDSLRIDVAKDWKVIITPEIISGKRLPDKQNRKAGDKSRKNAGKLKFDTGNRDGKKDGKAPYLSCEILLPTEDGEGTISYTVEANETQQIILDMDHISKKAGCPLKLWTPDSPYLYRCVIYLGKHPGDAIETYFGLRYIEISQQNGRKNICLNGKPIFLHGVLDQGYYSDGLFLPANPKGYADDIALVKRLGFNMLRKHIKVEPELFYYYCDQMGMLVMQDMVNNGSYSFIRDTGLPTIGFKKHIEKSRSLGLPGERKRKAFFVEHSRQLMKQLHNHPSIIAYTIFNEGWGQFASQKVGDELRALDPGRLYDYTSGWFAHKGSDFDSVHEYFHPKAMKAKDKPLFLSECGGYSLALEDHIYSVDESYGYGMCRTREELTDRIIGMYEMMVLPSIKQGMVGSVLTQLSDIEDEVNGLITYDRCVVKVKEEKMQELAKRLHTASEQSDM